MTSLFRTETSTELVAAGPVIRVEEAPAPEQAQEPDEFEIVLGRRQLASVLFVATVTVAVLTSLSYVAGKSLAPAPKTVEVVRTVPVPEPAAAPAVVATLVPAKTVAKGPESPIFAEPRQGALYLQMGAVEKGIAVIFAEGLRTHGLEAFVAPGPNENIFRVLIGPLTDEHAYQKAKDAVGQIGLTTFARRYQQ
jgi:cell division septation protein DedD